MPEHSHAEHRPPVGQDPTKLGPPPPNTMSMGHLYPVGDILGVIDDRAEAERAIQALKEAGVPEGDVDLVDGAWFAQAMRANKERWNPIQRVVALLGAEEGEVVRDYIEEADQGHTIVVVHAEQREAWERIARVLRAHGAHHLRHYGRSEMAEL
jgi:hypothetical protein